MHWRNIYLQDQHVVHVLPLDDLRPHEELTECWCRPRLDEGVCVHNALDQRESYETGERKPS